MLIYRMKSGVFLILAAVLLPLLVHAQKTVVYQIEYSLNGTCSGVNPEPLNVTTSDFSTVLDIMEQAAREGGRSYRFSTTFSSQNGVTGYTLNTVNGRRSEEPCDWSFYVRSGDETVRSDIGISFYIPGAGFAIILRYEEQIASSTITTTYSIQHLPLCSTATPPDDRDVTTPMASGVFDIMEEAVAKYGQQYIFSVDYTAVEGGGGDYAIQRLTGLEQNGSCAWMVFITPPGGMKSLVLPPLSEFAIPGDGYTLTLEYTEPEEPTTAAATMATTGAAKGIGVAEIAVLVFSSLCLVLLQENWW